MREYEECIGGVWKVWKYTLDFIYIIKLVLWVAVNWGRPLCPMTWLGIWRFRFVGASSAHPRSEVIPTRVAIFSRRAHKVTTTSRLRSGFPSGLSRYELRMNLRNAAMDGTLGEVDRGRKDWLRKSEGKASQLESPERLRASGGRFWGQKIWRESRY